MKHEISVCQSEEQQAVTLGAVELFEQLDVEVQESILALLREILKK
ncbi:MAG: hypothetical protein ACI4KA_01670 [Oscillospiraceae bacterium]